MPLGLGLGLGLQKPTPPPVSSWPTIADIPQGAIVLDTDGVVKQKRGNELLTMAETAIMLVHNGEPVTQTGEVILVDDPGLRINVDETNFIDVDENNNILLDEA